MDKSIYRRQIRSVLKTMDDQTRQEKSKAICQNLFSLADFRSAHTILSYAAMPREADPSNVLYAAKQYNKRVAFPICLANSEMVAAIPHTAQDWEIGAHNIAAPIFERSTLLSPQDLQLIIVPGIAFTHEGARLGQGGGYYDRYLKKTNAKRVGFAFDMQILPDLPLESHDLKMDIVVTESQIFYC